MTTLADGRPVTAPTGESHNAFAGQGAVLLDIGGEVGALVVTMPPEMEGVEVEIRPAGWTERRHDLGHVHHPHVAVVIRPTSDGPVASLVYPAVRQGDYDLAIVGDETAQRRVSVSGGQVTTESWS